MDMTITPSTDHIGIKIEEPRLDAMIAMQFKDRLREVIAKFGQTIRLDMKNVDFIDSSGLGAVIAVHKSMPDKTRLILSDVTPNVERVFRLTRMDGVIALENLPAEGP